MSTNLAVDRRARRELAEDLAKAQSERAEYKIAATKALEEAAEARALASRQLSINAEKLNIAWMKYVKLLGDTPRGTVVQFKALLELLPRCPECARGTTGTHLDNCRALEEF